MTFTEYCEQRLSAQREEARSAADRAREQEQELVGEIARVTARSEDTVLFWIKYGRRPMRAAQEAIAEHVGIPVGELFPGEREEVRP